MGAKQLIHKATDMAKVFRGRDDAVQAPAPATATVLAIQAP
jgi:hypothetical protein